MKNVQVGTKTRACRIPLLILACGMVIFLSIISSTGQTKPPQDGRPRRAETTQKPTPSPSPTTPRRNEAPPVLGEPPPPPPTWRPTPTPPAEEQEVDPGSIVKVNTDLVSLNVRVVDRLNHPISDVRQADFRVFEDGTPQPIEFFTREEVPISYGLAIDTSGSLRSQIDKVIEAGKILVNGNKEGDETFLVRFVDMDKIETVQDFTSNKSSLNDALDSLYIEGGQTDILDAVYLSAERVSQYRKGEDSDRRRRALVLVTDGENRASYYSQEQLFSRLREEDVQIFVIGFVNELDKEGGMIRKSPREKAMNLLERLAKETGGRVFYPNSLSELPQIAGEISRDLRTQYVISYSPTNRARDGSYRAIRVVVNDGPRGEKRIALTRSGRLAGREGGAPSTSRPTIRGSNSTLPEPSNRGTRKRP